VLLAFASEGVYVEGFSGEAMDNEHVRAEEGTFSIRDSRKDPLGNASCMGTWGKGARATDVEDGVKGTATVGVGGVVHDSSMPQCIMRAALL
jgi:hypothetical protein